MTMVRTSVLGGKSNNIVDNFVYLTLKRFNICF